MTHILQITTGGKYKITKEEAESIVLIPEDESVVINRLGVSVPKRMVIVYPQNSPDEIEDRKRQQTGVLSDGTQVRRHFGQWITNNDFVPDDDGNYQPVRLDPQYYPEIARDRVMTEEEYSEYRKLPMKEAIKYLEEFNESGRRTGNSGMVALSDILKE